MKVFILAAGMGTRLGAYTKEIPKCLVKINGLPLIYFQKEILDNFKNLKNNIYIITGYQNNKINIENFKKIINPKYKSTNMLYSLFFHKSLLYGSVIISYGDIVYSKGILKKLIKSKAMISVVIDTNWKKYWKTRFKNPIDDAESLKIDKNGYITEIGSKVNNIDEIQGQYIGLIKLSPIGAKLFKEHYSKNKIFNGKIYKKAYLTDFLNDLISNGTKIKAVFINQPWIEIDNEKDIKSKTTLQRLKKINQ